MAETMRAVVLDGPGPPEALVIREIPVPEPLPGWVLIRVMAFGLNRSELHMRLGLAEGVTFPRVPGIEAAGAGADHVLIDDGQVAAQVGRILPGGADAALELVGTPTLPDTLRSVRVHGVVCFTGMLSNQWTVRDFYPIDYLPRGVRLTAYGGEAADLPPRLLQDFLNGVSAGTAAVPVGRVYHLDEIVQAHADMEANRVSGKLVVLV